MEGLSAEIGTLSAKTEDLSAEMRTLSAAKVFYRRKYEDIGEV